MTVMSISGMLARMVRSYQPNMKPRGAGLMVLLYGIILVGVAVWLFMQDRTVREAQESYHLLPIGKDVKLKIDIKYEMKSPVFVYLNYHDFYQNHRAIVKSLSKQQLEDKAGPRESSLGKVCAPGSLFNKDLLSKRGIKTSITGAALLPENFMNPCGFLARAFPEDLYKTIKTPSGEVIPIEFEDVASPYDPKFGSDNKEEQAKIDVLRWVNVTTGRFRNWMKVSSDSDFMKLWGIIKKDLSPGFHEITMDIGYPEASVFAGKKYVLLSTSNIIGGKNQITYIAFALVGSLCVFFGFILLFLSFRTVKFQGVLRRAGAADKYDLENSLL